MAQTPDIEVYSGDYCPYCTRAKQLLQSKNLPFKEIRVDVDPTERQRMIERANGRRTIPQIFINGTHVGGCDDLYALESAGKLDELVNQG